VLGSGGQVLLRTARFRVATRSRFLNNTIAQHVSPRVEFGRGGAGFNGAALAAEFAVRSAASVVVVEPSENRRDFFVSALASAGYVVIGRRTIEEVFTETPAVGSFLILRLCTLGRFIPEVLAGLMLAGMRPIVVIPQIPYSRLREQLDTAGATSVVDGSWNIEAVVDVLRQAEATLT
jgi:hypothetical protein